MVAPINRRKKVSKPKVFNEKRESMMLIESARPSDIYMWCFCICIMFVILSVCLALAVFNHYY